MKTFDLLQQFKLQGQEEAKARQKYDEKQVAAGEHVRNLKAQYQALFQEELKTGADKSAEKAEMLSKIQEAEKAYEIAKEERVQAYQHFSGSNGEISRPDVVQAWLNEYVPAVKAEVLGPILARIEAARSEYLNALLDIVEIADDYRDVVREVYEIDRGAHAAGEQPYTHGISNPVTLDDIKNPISDQDIRLVTDYRQLPPGVERVRTELTKTTKGAKK